MGAFHSWCQLNGAPRLPASVASVVKFISDCGHLSPDALHAELTAIDEEHENLLYAPPCKSKWVVKALKTAHHIEPPRSWPKDMWQHFDALSWPIKTHLAAREAERDQAVRKAQNEAAEARKQMERLRNEKPAKDAIT